MKKHVAIRDETGRICGRFAELSVTTDSLRRICSEYGPGQYRISWSENQMVESKNGKRKRKAITRSKFIRIYDENGAVVPRDRGAVVIHDRRPDVSAFSGFMAEIKQGFDDIRARLEDLESDDEEEDYEEAPLPQEPEFLERILTVMRQPKYEPLMNALLIGEDSQQAQRVDAVFAQNPTLPREIVLDLMQMIVSANRAA